MKLSTSFVICATMLFAIVLVIGSSLAAPGTYLGPSVCNAAVRAHVPSRNDLFDPFYHDEDGDNKDSSYPGDGGPPEDPAYVAAVQTEVGTGGIETSKLTDYWLGGLQAFAEELNRSHHTRKTTNPTRLFPLMLELSDRVESEQYTSIYNLTNDYLCARERSGYKDAKVSRKLRRGVLAP